MKIVLILLLVVLLIPNPSIQAQQETCAIPDSVFLSFSRLMTGYYTDYYERTIAVVEFISTDVSEECYGEFYYEASIMVLSSYFLYSGAIYGVNMLDSEKFQQDFFANFARSAQFVLQTIQDQTDFSTFRETFEYYLSLDDAKDAL